MRTHKTIKEIKDRYTMQAIRNLKMDDIDEIANEILTSLKINGICPPIIDIINKLGFTVYNYPFEKECEGKDKDVLGVLAIGIDFNIHENSNFMLLEKDCSEKIRRFISAYLLGQYLFNIDDDTTDFYHYVYYSQDKKNNIETRFALSLLMPKDIFLAQIEFLKMAYKTADKILSKEDMINILSDTFCVTPGMIKARMLLLKNV